MTPRKRVTDAIIIRLKDTMLTITCPSLFLVKAVAAAFNQEKALMGAFSVIMNLRVDFSLKL